MDDEAVIFAYITTSGRDEARSIGKEMVEKGMAACANMFPMESIYRWEGKVEQDEEYVLILKTRQGRREELEREVRKVHSYDCPCILFFKAEGGSRGYVNWIRDST